MGVTHSNMIEMFVFIIIPQIECGRKFSIIIAVVPTNGQSGGRKCMKEDWSSNGLTGQLHDLVLGPTEHISSDPVINLPLILYPC